MLPTNINNKDRSAVNEFLIEVQRHFNQNIISVKIYGSKVIGNDSVESDIDILLILKKITDRRRTTRLLSEIESKINIEYGVLISSDPIEEKYYKDNSNLPFIKEVNKHGIAL